MTRGAGAQRPSDAPAPTTAISSIRLRYRSEGNERWSPHPALSVRRAWACCTFGLLRHACIYRRGSQFCSSHHLASASSPPRARPALLRCPAALLPAARCPLPAARCPLLAEETGARRRRRSLDAAIDLCMSSYSRPTAAPDPTASYTLLTSTILEPKFHGAPIRYNKSHPRQPLRRSLR